RERLAAQEAMLIEREGPKPRRTSREDVPRVGVAWVLQSNLGLCVDQKVGQQVERLLCTDGDQYLVVRGPDASQGQDLVANLLEQQRVIAGDQVLSPVQRVAA